METKPTVESKDETNARSLNEEETQEWLSSNGLKYDVDWRSGYAILAIIPEVTRGWVIKGAADHLEPSFAIIRNPIGLDYRDVDDKYTIRINPLGSREYDVYAIGSKTNTASLVEEKTKKLGDDNEFVSDKQCVVIDEYNKEILKGLGCNFDWKSR